MDEALVIQECRKGNSKAQEELYKHFAPKMLGLYMRYSGDKETTHDLLQEGFIKVFTNLSDYNGSGSFEGWLQRIFTNCALERIRKNKFFPEVWEERFQFFRDRSWTTGRMCRLSRLSLL